ncbi:phosphotransferase family protein [Streptomyces sp. NPDC002499]
MDAALSTEILRLASLDGTECLGHHNANYVWRLPVRVAGQLGLEPGRTVVVRVRKDDVLPVALRTWYDEGAILDYVRQVLPLTPECLAEGHGFTIHSYAEGEPLSSRCESGKPVDSLFVGELADQLARMARTGTQGLPPLPSAWPRDGDSQGFLQALVARTEWRIRRSNWAAFGGLFKALGVPADALVRFGRQVPGMKLTNRPYALLHADLHRDNVIVSEAAASPVVCTDWELATYGDPLHDLATHLVRMEYPDYQWDEVVELWAKAQGRIRPEAVRRLDDDLRHYIAFERAQSVFPDVMRAARDLEFSSDEESLHRATARVCRALENAEEPLRLSRVPGVSEVGRILFRWQAARSGVRGAHRGTRARTIDWTPDPRLPERPEFPHSAVRVALAAEGAAPAERIQEGTVHRTSVVWPTALPFPVVVRRRMANAVRREQRALSEHIVLRAIEESSLPVSAPKLLALGSSCEGESFAIHTHVGGPDLDGPPHHPVDGLLPHEADSLVDQLCALAQVDHRQLDPVAGEGGFLRRLCTRLVSLVAGLPKESQEVARLMGLPDAERLDEILSRCRVTERRPALLHGDLHPWNLVRHDGYPWLTLIDWKMSMVGDPLYDLVRHMHLARTLPTVYVRMFRRWESKLDESRTRDWRKDRNTYRSIETVRSAYVDLDCLVTGAGLEAPQVLRATRSYSTTLLAAGRVLGVPVRPAVHVVR